jgi:hypothetical protein
MRIVTLFLLLAAQFFVLSPARGGELDISGTLELQARAFLHGPAWTGQDDQALQGSVIATTEFRWRSELGDRRVSLIPHLRWDGNDSERSLLDFKGPCTWLTSSTRRTLPAISTAKISWVNQWSPLHCSATGVRSARS